MNYTPGKHIETVKQELKLKKVIKLASNESPYKPHPKIKKIIKKAIDKINRYPDSTHIDLKTKLAEKFQLSPENFFIGNGSDEIMDLIIRAFLNKNDELIIPEVSFKLYEVLANLKPVNVVKVKLKNFKIDLEEMRKNISPKTKAIIICNPNNPTGTIVTKFEVEKFISNINKKILIIFDEAYKEFVSSLDFPESIDYIKKYKNIIVLRTFSKIYSLAGLRIGYAISQPNNIKILNNYKLPFNVNSIALSAAYASLELKNYIEKIKTKINEGKEKIYEKLKKIKIEYIPSETNFILIKINKKNLAKELLYKGIIVREMEEFGLKGFIRVTIGTPYENRIFLKLLTKCLNQ